MRVKEEVINTIVIEKSRFICYIKSVFSEEEYKEYLKEIKKKHYDSSHVCSALLLDNIKRSNDDGEPSGTAGAPILNVLEKNNLSNTCAIVVRYFGGIKLGTGGLIRAYGGAVTEAFDLAIKVEDVEYNTYTLSLSYELANKVDNFINQNTKVINKTYELDITYTFLTNDLKIIDKISEYTKGINPLYIKKTIIEEMI